MFGPLSSKGSTPKRVMSSAEVDKYINKVQSRLNTPLEKKSKAFAFARLYYDAKDYELSKKYLEEYISVQERDFRVHNLMGEVNEELGNFEDAFVSYKRSLELNSTQKEVLVKVMILCTKCSVDPWRAKVWADKGAKYCPGHPAVFDVKWHILSQESPKDHEEMELLIADELSRRARDSSLHIKLVKLYMETESLHQAYMHCQSVEKTGVFDEDLQWLICATDIFDHYRKKEDGAAASFNYAMALCKLMHVRLKLSSARDCIPTLKRMDTALHELKNTQSLDVRLGAGRDMSDALNEMKGQLYKNTAIYIMKLALEGALSYAKVNRLMCVCLMVSWLVEPPTMTSKLFTRHSPSKRQNLQPYEWSVLACSRLSETGHILLAMESQFGEEWITGCVQDFCNPNGQKVLMETLNMGSDDVTESFLAQDQNFFQVEVKIPDTNELVKYDEVSVSEKAQDLQLIIWLGLHWDKLNERIRPGVGVMVGRMFEGIALDVKNLSNCHFTSLSLRDVEAFIYAVIRSSKSIHMEAPRDNEDQLHILPVEISPTFVTSAQGDWWRAAYGLYTGKVGIQGAAKLKVILQKGLETIRCLRDHGIDPRILIYMANAFWEKAVAIESEKKVEFDYQDHWESLQRRAVFYMKEAIRILEIYQRNKTITVVELPLIHPLAEPLLADVIEALVRKGYLRLAESAMLSGDLDGALKLYDEVSSLQAVYSQAQIYMKLASGCDLDTVNGEKDHLYYTTKAKEKLNLCISNADHSPEFKATLLEHLHEIEQATANALVKKTGHSKPKKCLNFASTTPRKEGSAKSDFMEDTPLIMSDNLPVESAWQDQLNAKEKENQILRQTLEMYKTQMHLQRQQQFLVQPQFQQSTFAHTPVAVPSQPIGAPGQYIVQQPTQLMQHPAQVQSGALVRPVVSTGSVFQHTMQPSSVPPNLNRQVNRVNSNGSAVVTPTFRNGVETPTDMWWDSFSPQASFEKGYFAGLAEHVEQSRELLGETEAPTMRDVDTTPAADKSNSINETPQNDSLNKTPLSATRMPTFDGDDIYVEPIVNLESKGPCKTGEEDEVVKFAHRAKLYRFDKNVNQWKERGIGEVKILVHERSNKARITMRRDQVFRVCCNHFITSDMSLDSKEGSKAAWTWCTPADASEDEVRPEQFTIKFKSQEIADQFKEVFKACQSLPARKESLSGNRQRASESIVKNANKEAMPGQWTCGNCHGSNTLDAMQCIACKNVKPGCIDLNAGTILGTPSLVGSIQGQMPVVVSQGAFPQDSALKVNPIPSSTVRLATPAQITSNNFVPSAFTPNMGEVQPDIYDYTVDGSESLDYDPNIYGYYDDECVDSYHADGTTNQFNMYTPGQPLVQQPDQNFGYSVNGKPETKFAGTLPTLASSTQFKPAQNIVTTSPEGKPLFKFAFSNQTSKPESHPFLSGATQQDTSKINPFAGFTFQKPASEVNAQNSGPAAVSSPFSGFSFSSKPTNSQVDTSSPQVSTVKTTNGTGFPMLTSLLQTSVAPSTTTQTVISGMNTLPVFGKGVITTGIDPTAFWTAGASSNAKPFFTGNTTSLETIGHQEEPRTVDEEEFFKENSEVTNDIEEGEIREQDYYYEDDYGQYRDDEEYDGNYDEYDSDDEYEDYDNEDDYQGSVANSSRRGSNEAIGEVVDDSKQVEERFEIQKREPSRDLSDVIDDEVIITHESKPSFAQKIKASRLQLPQTFYLYETKQPCPGCRGCVENYHQEIISKPEGQVQLQNQEITANSKASEASLEPVFGAKSSTLNSFAALSSNNSVTSGFIGGSGPFSGAGAALFGEKEEEEGYNEDSYDPQYEAIVQVTKLDTIKTGEEDDEIIFKHRAKLYRFDKQWKDRGIGDIKLTKNAKTGYCRVIMRRDIVYKLCANHAIMPNMELNMLESSDRSWIWFTPSDYSEGLPPQPQQFCVKFKNKQVATEFKTRFEELKLVMDELLKAEKLNEEKSFETEPLLDNQPAEIATDEKEITSTNEDFATKVGLKEGQWECSDTSNTNLLTLNANKNEMKFVEGSTENSPTKFSFGLPQAEGISFGTSNSDALKLPSSKESQPLFGGIKESNTNSASPNLLNAASEDEIRNSPFDLTKNQFVNDSPFKFVVPGAKPGSSSIQETNKEEKQKTGSISPEKDTVELPPSSPTKYNDNEDADIHVEAIVHISKLDKVTTGEEGEDILFRNRAKLYRFSSDSKTWKERGIGQIKLTHNKEHGTCRVIMRRDQVHKLCANHAIVEFMELKPLKSEKSWTWFTQADISDGETKPEQFSVRFKTVEIAQEFKSIFEKCLTLVKKKAVLSAETNEKPKESFFASKSQFTPKEGAWECGTCLIQNDADKEKCPACETPNPKGKKSNEGEKTTPFKFGANQMGGFAFGNNSKNMSSAFSFGIQKASENSSTETKIDNSTKFDLKSQFALKEGSWECGMCLIQNNADKTKCVACQAANPAVTIDSNSEPSKPVSFKFGTNQTGGSLFGVNPVQSQSSSGFSFGMPKTSETSIFSFGKKSDVSSSGFSFGVAKNQETPSLLFGTQQAQKGISCGAKPDVIPTQEKNNDTENNRPDIEKQGPSNQQNSAPRSLDPDPNPWQCSACLSQNHSSREKCRSCSSTRMKTPVVRLDPKKFSEPFNLTFENRDQTPMVYAPKEGQSKFSESLFGTGSSLGTKNTTKDFSPGQSNLPKPDLTAISDRELMPPPKDIPIKTNTSPKQSGTKKDKDSIFSWMPKGLSADHLFSFGTTPSPTLSAASSVDDIPATSFANVPSAFSGTTFSFKFETPAKSPVTKEAKSPEVTSPTTLEEESTAAFTPLVTLNKVEKETGEEQENVMFYERTKMFRFDSQWKERGVGEIKILKHKDLGLFRLIMRRDRTHKLCANHGLITGMQVKPMSGNNKRAYVWKTNADASDDEGLREQMFAARFKDEEIAERFAKTFKLACEEAKFASGHTGDSKEASVKARPDILQMVSKTNRVSQVIEISDDDEEREKPSLPDGVSLTYEPTLSKEVKEKTKQLLLPKSFYHTPSLNIGKDRPSKTKEGSSKAILTDSNARIDDKIIAGAYRDEEEIKNAHEIEIIFDDACEVLEKRDENRVANFTTLTDGRIKIIRNTEIDKHFVVAISAEGKVNLQYDTAEVNAKIQKGSRHICKFTKLTPEKSLEYYAKFTDMLSLEKFVSCLIEIKRISMDKPKTANVETNGLNSETEKKHIFGNSSNTLSFASLSAKGESGFQNNTGKMFSSSGNTVFDSEAIEESPENRDICVQPIVELSTVTVSTGEEEEEVHFKQRCKLYRYDTSVKKWKESGVGEMKLLYNRNMQKSRLVMRRDQVHKLCANHALSETMKLELFPSNELTVTWNALGDISDNSAEDKLLAAKFKNKDILSEFKNTFALLCNVKSVPQVIKVTNGVELTDSPRNNGTCDITLSKMISSI